MKRCFITTRVIELEYATPFEGERLKDQLLEYLKTEPDVAGEYANVLEYDANEVTSADDIARAIGDEIAEIVGQMVFVNPIGDNGDDDRGYEIVNANGKRCIADIGIMRTDGVWEIFVTRG